MCNPNTDLNIEYLRLLATKATEGYDSEEFVDEISQAIRGYVYEFIERLVAAEGLPESGSGWQIGDVELLLVKNDSGYIPSVRSEYWDAPASTWGEGTEIADPLEALTTGLTDALAQQLSAELTPEDEEDDNE